MNAQNGRTLRLAAVGLLLALVSAAQALPPGNLNPSKPGNAGPRAQGAAHATLRESAEAEGAVRVIVQLSEAGLPPLKPVKARPSARGNAGGALQFEPTNQLAQRRKAVGQAQRAFVARHNLAPGQVREFNYLPLMVVEADSALLDELLSAPDVVAVTPDDFNETQLTSTLSVVGGHSAHDFGWDGTGYDVAIIDTGVQTNHPMLAGNVRAETAACFSNPLFLFDESLCPDDVSPCTDAEGNVQADSACGIGAAEPCGPQCGHGTHVAGIAAGDGSEVGVAPGAGIIPINVFIGRNTDSDPAYELIGAYDSDIIRGLEYVLQLAATRNIAAVNMSLGSGVYISTATCDSWESGVKTVVDQLRELGVATVVAAGNNGSSSGLSSPGCISTVISVGSTNDSDQISSFSNESPAMTLHAPGENVTSAYPWNDDARLGGTSMAAPHVAGAMALLRQKTAAFGLDATVDNLIAALQQTGAEMYSGDFKVPRLDVQAGLAALDGPLPVTVTVDETLNGDQVAVIAGSATSVPSRFAYGGEALRGDTAATNRIRFTPDLPQDGFYRVSLIWPSFADAGAAIDVEIVSPSGNDYQMIDQTGGAGRWESVGLYHFPAGADGYVELADEAGGRLLADAVRFELVNADVAIRAEALPTGYVRQPYLKVLAAVGGTLPYTWTVTGGSLPQGLSLDASTGEVVGTPTQSGQFAFTATVHDGTGDTSSQAFSVTVVDTVELSGQVLIDSDGDGLNGVEAATPLAGVLIGAGSETYCEETDANGLYSCIVPLGWSGTISPAESGYRFEPASLEYNQVTTDQSAQDFVAQAQQETVWIEDHLPAGASPFGLQEGWTWQGSNPAAFSGSTAHQSASAAGIHHHGFQGATETLPVAAGDTLITYVYLDPANLPRSLALHFKTTAGTWARAYWGEDLQHPNWGFTSGTTEWMPMGALPASGQWVRLEVPASLLALEGSELEGMAFSLYDGRATWDYTGVARPAAEPALAISGAVTRQSDGQPLGGVTVSGADCTTTDAAGLYSCQVAAGWSGTLAPTLAGYDFTPAQLSFTDVAVDQANQDFTAQAQQETVWIEDGLPAGASTFGLQEGWSWQGADPVAFSGTVAHRSAIAAGIHHHGFKDTTEALAVEAGDMLFTYVYLDPANLPRSLALHFKTTAGTWARAYWGEDLQHPNWGFTSGTTEWMPLGALPPSGQWVRLEVSAALLGLEGTELDGMAFSLYDGRATWDYSGLAH
ncbi:S8 family serine peptidase [uncultured Thiohalocapsa sp.]|uniref:S8 family serine peptidase n=1 Tax=uncultured Thiohalocapsa sp. TaxID=768990 RepID=UPI0025D1B15C|nr:S8 family serine peptidase [uncultured Thiohalocapsa sp.]